MMVSIDRYVRSWQRQLRAWASDPRVREAATLAGYALTGFALSAASLGNYAQSLVLGLLCGGVTGLPAALIALGGGAGYLLFWGGAGVQGVMWTVTGLTVALTLGGKAFTRQAPLLLPAIAGLIAAAWGLIFQVWRGDDPPISIYVLRFALAMGSARLSWLTFNQRSSVTDWLAGGIAILALAQIAPLTFLNFGSLAAGFLAVTAPLPGAALAGVALDLAQITDTPMTAVMCLAFLLRLIPRLPKWSYCCAAGLSYLVVMYFVGVWDFNPVPVLLLGGLISMAAPGQAPAALRRGETGAAQVRLELAAGVLSQSEQLLLEVQDPPIDEQALIVKAAERACGSCPCRKSCREQEHLQQLNPRLLYRPLLDQTDFAAPCRKAGRVLQELRRSQEQLRSIKSDRQRRQDHRWAVIQQYRFLAEYLQDVSDSLARRTEAVYQHFQPEIAASTAGREAANGDRCAWFPGPGCKYYVLLCDGMGTGLGAAEESRIAAGMLKKMLTAGYPAEYALQSLNSLCALRSSAGAVTVDLAELHLDTGRSSLYKWGASPSYLLRQGVAQKIGTAGPPPGLSVTEGRETVERLSLRRGETLVLLSDGAGGEDILPRAIEMMDQPPGEIAAGILAVSEKKCDDATVAVIRLSPITMST